MNRRPNTSDSVAFYGSAESIRKARENRRWFGWPALAYKVRIPQARNPSIDLFQEYVLRMVVAGVRNAAGIAGRLGLETELVRFVLAGLREADLLDVDGAPTPAAGRQLDSSENVADGDEAIGYMFADGFTGNLFPTFQPGSLKLVETQRLKKDLFDFSVGSAGTPLENKATIIDRPSRRPDLPDAPSLLGAWRDFVFRQVGARSESASNGPADSATRFHPNVREIALLDHETTPVLLLTYARLPSKTLQFWQVRDPFGPGDSPCIRESIRREAETDESARRFLEKLKDDADLSDSEKRLLSQRRRGENSGVDRALTRLEWVEQKSKQASPPKPGLVSDHAEAVATALGRAFAELQVLYPCSDDILRTIGTRAETAELLRGRCRELGFRLPPDSMTFWSVSPVSVRKSLRDGSMGLREWFATAVLSSISHPTHPLAGLALSWPAAIEELFRVWHFVERIRTDNRGSDDLPDRASVYRWCREILPGLAGDGSMPQGRDSPTDAGRLRASVVMRLEEEIDTRRMLLPPVAPLIEMQLAAQRLSMRALDDPERAEEIEAIIRSGCESVGASLSAILAESRTTLPQAPSRGPRDVPQDRVRIALRGGPATLPCLGEALKMAHDLGSDLVRKLRSEFPDLLRRLDGVYALRNASRRWGDSSVETELAELESLAIRLILFTP